MKTLLLPRLFLVLAVFGLRLGLAAQTYTITNLGLGWASDVNNSGHVVGTRLDTTLSFPYYRGLFFNGQTNEVLTTTNLGDR